MSRDTLLARLRIALGAAAADNAGRAERVAARLAAPPRHRLPAFATLAGPPAADRLIRCLEGQGADVIESDDLTALPSATARILAAAPQPMHFVRSADARFASLPWPSDATPTRWTRDQPLGDGSAALTHAVAGVAETGTLVLASQPENPSALAFLPEVHIVALARDSIVGSFEEALARLAARGASLLPRAVNLVSSPSRTSDIGGRSVRGAHGPRRLVVVIYGPRSAD